MFEIKELYIGLAYDIGDGTIDHAFTKDLIYHHNEDSETYDFDYFYVKYNPEIFIRLK